MYINIIYIYIYPKKHGSDLSEPIKPRNLVKVYLDMAPRLPSALKGLVRTFSDKRPSAAHSWQRFFEQNSCLQPQHRCQKENRNP